MSKLVIKKSRTLDGDPVVVTNLDCTTYDEIIKEIQSNEELKKAVSVYISESSSGYGGLQTNSTFFEKDILWQKLNST
jgi:hypothetical protein